MVKFNFPKYPALSYFVFLVGVFASISFLNYPVVKNSSFVASVINSNIKTFHKLVQVYEPVPDCITNPEWCGINTTTDGVQDYPNDSTKTDDVPYYPNDSTKTDDANQVDCATNPSACVPSNDTNQVDCFFNPELCGRSTDEDNIYIPEDDTYIPPEDDTYIPPEDDTYIPPEDDTYIPPEDDTYIPPEDEEECPTCNQRDDDTYTPEEEDDDKKEEVKEIGTSPFPEDNNDILVQEEDDSKKDDNKEGDDKEKEEEEEKKPTGPEEKTTCPKNMACRAICYENEEETNYTCPGYEKCCIPIGKKGEIKTKPRKLVASMDIYLDPLYVSETKIERNFTPTEPINPFDDILCELKVERTEYGSQRSFEAVLTSDLGKFNFRTETTPWQINKGILSYTESDDFYDYYRWNIKGWNGGSLNSIISDSSFSNNEKELCKNCGYSSENSRINLIFKALTNIKCEVKAQGKTIVQSPQKPISKCMQLYGGTASKNLFRTSFTFNEDLETIPKSRVKKSIEAYRAGFWGIDPYKSYKDAFSFYLNLDSIAVGFYNSYTREFGNAGDYLKEYFDPAGGESSDGNNRSCRGMSQNVIYASDRDSPEDNSYPALGLNYNNGVLVVFTKKAENLNIEKEILMHEVSHTFSVGDEYLALEIPNSLNCIEGSNPNDVSADPCAEYQKEFPGYYADGCYRGCGNSPINNYRSTADSIMRGGRENVPFKLNNVSCTPIVQKITDLSKKEAYQKCATLDTIKSDQCRDNIDCNSYILKGFPNYSSLGEKMSDEEIESLHLTGSVLLGCGRCTKKDKEYKECVYYDKNTECSISIQSGEKNTPDKIKYGQCVGSDSKLGSSTCLVNIDWECGYAGGGCKKGYTCNIETHKCMRIK